MALLKRDMIAHIQNEAKKGGITIELAGKLIASLQQQGQNEA